MTVFILKYLFLFGTGSIFGWILELFYRRYFGKAKEWINPGFLSGPYLPIYGTGVSVLYIVSDLSINFTFKIILFAIFTTLIEYITGLFFLKYYNARLWDYSNLKFNIKGLVSPLYSFFWTVLSLFFYYVLYPYFYNQIEFLYQNLQFSLFVGVLYGIIIVDVNNSFNVLNRIKELTETIEESSVVIYLEDFKRELKFKYINIKSKARKPQFLLPFKGVSNLKEYIKDYLEKLKIETLDELKNDKF